MSKERISPIEAFLAGTLIVGGTYGIGVAAKKIDFDKRAECDVNGETLKAGQTLETRYLNEQGQIVDRFVVGCNEEGEVYSSDAYYGDKIVIRQTND